MVLLRNWLRPDWTNKGNNMSGWNPDEYPDEGVAGQANSILEDLESEQAQQAEQQAQVVETLSEAMKRIEEANLWKTLLTLDVFQQGSARPEIVAAVNAKIKDFAMNNLKYCVGIESESSSKKEKKEEVKLPFDTDELTALKILAAKVLKRDIASAVVAKEYSPQVAQVNSTDATAAAPKLQTVASGNKTQVQAAKPAAPSQPKTVNMAPRKKAPARPKPGAGYIPPTSGYVPPSQGPTVSSEGVKGQVDMSNLVNTLIQAASGGNVLAQNTEPVSGDDVNERF